MRGMRDFSVLKKNVTKGLWYIACVRPLFCQCAYEAFYDWQTCHADNRSYKTEEQLICTDMISVSWQMAATTVFLCH